MKHFVLLVVLALTLGATLPVASQAPGDLQPETPPVLGTSLEPAVGKEPEAAPGEELVSIIVTFDQTVNGRDLERASGGKATYRYREIMNGAALILAREAIPSVAGLAGVTGVYHDRVVNLATLPLPDGAGRPEATQVAAEPAVLGGPENAGEGVVVGIIDSGIWPEHPFFADPDPAGAAYPPPRVTPGEEGIGGRVRRSTCDFGATDHHPDDAIFACNNKLIGAYRFMDTYDALHGPGAGAFASARDDHGSGTRTASVVAGAGSFPGQSGAAPRAHLIAYRVAGGVAGDTADGLEGSAYHSDIAAAIEQAIFDGVDVLAYSFGGGSDPYGEVPSLALLEAYDRGIFVAAPAGNSGPNSDTVLHREPWVTVAAASTRSPVLSSNSGAAAVTVTLGGPLGLVASFVPSASSGQAPSASSGQAPSTGGVRIASFSSRGGPGQTLGTSKPDISAPGSENEETGPESAASTVAGSRPLAGTAVSAAHVAGAAAVLKYLHPSWEPGQIQSALMTSARARGLYNSDGRTLAGPFDTGSGGLDLDRAARVSVTFSAAASQFTRYEDSLWYANLPSLYLPAFPGRVVVQRRVENTHHDSRKWILSTLGPDDVSIAVPNQLRIQGNSTDMFEISVDARDVPQGEVRQASIEFEDEDGLVLHMPVTLVRHQAPVSLDTTCSQVLIPPRVTTTCQITVTNNSEQDAAIVVTDPLPDRLGAVPGSVSGATLVDGILTFEDTLAGAVPPLRLASEPPLYGYVPLADFGLEPAPCPDDCDDGGFVVTGLDFVYQDIHYDEAIWSVNGTLELGTSGGTATSGANMALPDPSLPNNLLAPWWTDLDLSASGQWYLGSLSDGQQVYDVFEWRDVPRYQDEDSRASFQIWLARGTNLGWFTYGQFSGETADGTTGVEDAMGITGMSAYYGEGGIGAVPSGDLHLDQNSGAPGQTHTITFTAQGLKKGRWQNCARMEGDLWGGEAIACFTGQVME